MTIAADLLTLPPPERRAWLAEQDEDDYEVILVGVRDEFGTPYALWRDDPVGFIEDVLGEFIWLKQRAIAESVRDNRRTAVPACHAPGKTHIAARLVAWWLSVHEPGSAKAVTTATTFPQVRALLWPHIIRVAARHDLPGRRNQTEWHIGEEIVGWGFSPSKWDEAAGQGIHAEKLLVIVDEAGGIAQLLGDNLNGLMTGESTRMLAVGNPPTDEDGTWFEAICQSPLWNNISIPAFVTPNFTGEHVPPDVARVLVDQRWVNETAAEYGTDSAYFIARVLAEFPKVFGRKVVPVGWLEAAMDNEHPGQSDWQRLGVDVAAGGGDEMSIAYADGWDVRVVEVWSGADTADQTVNADRVLEWILRAEGRQNQLGYLTRRVRVKVDGIGVGAGTADILAKMGKDGKHNADIVKVVVSQTPTDKGRFRTRRDECWWTLREAIRDGTVRLLIDGKAKAQIAAPSWETNSAGKIVVESKESIKKRGLASPDRADSIGLAIYEPTSVAPARTYTTQTAEAAQSVPRAPARRT